MEVVLPLRLAHRAADPRQNLIASPHERLCRSSRGGIGAFMLAASRNVFASLRSFTFASVFVGIGVLAACSSDEKPATPKCDSAKCAPGNTCIMFDGEEKCRKTCSSNADPAASCPFGYTCTDPETGVPPFCMQDTAVRDDGKPLEKKPSGQWGAKCQANLGIENPGCDTAQGFFCYGTAPTDGDAYCTRYDCEKDSDCGAGFWCGKINQTPNVQTAKRTTFGEVQNVCLRRTYCSTCKVDLDCPPIAGTAQHCLEDASGARFCAPECDDNQGCPTEAKCSSYGDFKACNPRAGVCVGDGSLCSPCRVDTDCGDDGLCVKGRYTTEKACAKKSTSSCGTEDKPAQGSCAQDTEVGSKKVLVRCLGAVLEEAPKDYCHGLYLIGKEGGGDVGCWTPNR